jgi:hypothetical protein
MAESNKRHILKDRISSKLFPCLLLFLLLTECIQAQDSLPDSVVTVRLQTIKQMLQEGKSGANRWWYGWLVGYSAATAAQGAAIFFSEDLSTRQDLALGAAMAFLGAAGQVITPNVPGYASGRLELIPEGTREERMDKLYEAEILLRESSRRETIGRSWKTHAIFTIVNLGGGLITWLGFDRDIWAGLGNFAMNTVITEAQIFSQPTRAIKDYQRYQNKYNAGLEQSDLPRDVYWNVNVYAGGFLIRVVF